MITNLVRRVPFTLRTDFIVICYLGLNYFFSQRLRVSEPAHAYLN